MKLLVSTSEFARKLIVSKYNIASEWYRNLQDFPCDIHAFSMCTCCLCSSCGWLVP